MSAPTRSKPSPRTLAWGAIVWLLVAIATVLTPGTVSAHSRLVSSNPSEGAILDVPPALVEFTFDEELLEGTTVISINDDLGNTIATTPVEPAGKTISAPWPAGAGSGTYQVAFRIVSADGHPVAGAVTFQVTGSEQPSASPLATEPSPIRSHPGATARSEMEGPGVGFGIVLVLIAVVGIASSVVVIVSRRRAQ